MQVCAPAIVYIGFSLTHIIIDTFKQLYNSAFMKFLVMIIFTLVLNILCKKGYKQISWLLVLLPLVAMFILIGLVIMVLQQNNH